MPSNRDGASGKSDTYVPLTTYAIHQSYGGWQNFMHSHGLKPWDLDDVEEGKRIVEGIKEGHRLDWEEEQKNKGRA
ncbi:hypothetical protein CC1G_07701 [Coprinopsis cinerea okayama7|uniref:Uncharacterized protein n=1 Tax=Coprinopsis cinerea (strain Okayama-7 / 130 / ATCC MYA-4618 / FGSC 9003) TaxID=240176 RepID=A8NBV4_COPC7|nr:hypothetical protein CC1G_07701 [Coprinopsis cinerea okayama7\|eukprot:XP_001832314.2 hypothetical protein CC1G_07701 [Coprinopsis cinerea okayama7\